MHKRIIATLAAVILTSALSAQSAFAQTAQQTQTQQQAQQQPASPLKFDFKANPGETVKDAIIVSNQKDEDMQIQTAVLDFEVISEEGGIRFTNVVNDEHKLAAWVRFTEPAFLLKKGEVKRVDFEIDVPQDAKVGTHWAMIFFQGFNPKGEKTIETVAGSNAFIFLTVKGEGLHEEGFVKSFWIEKSGKNALNFVLRFSNLGNVILAPRGTITIENIWGKPVDRIDLNPDAIVTPNAIGKIITNWQPKKGLSLGLYRAELKGYYGSKNTEFSTKASIWILPWEIGGAKYVLYVLAALVLIYLILRVFKIKITFVRAS